MNAPNPARVLNIDEPPLAGRVRFMATADRSVIPDIRRGVLFLMAFWSGTSFHSLHHLKRVLSRIDADGRLEVVIVDVDGCPDLYDAPEFFGKLHGNGEAAWVSRGKVVATAAYGSHPKAFETYTRYLLEECAV
jgi:hypothetical protein